MDVLVVSGDAGFIEELASAAAPSVADPAAPTLRVAEPRFTPGAADSWWTIAATFGVQAIPASIACNLIAAWIVSALAKARDRRVSASISVAVDGREVEIEIKSEEDVAALASRILASLASDVHGD